MNRWAPAAMQSGRRRPLPFTLARGAGVVLRGCHPTSAGGFPPDRGISPGCGPCAARLACSGDRPRAHSRMARSRGRPGSARSPRRDPT